MMESGEYVCLGSYLGPIMITHFGKLKLGEFSMRTIESLTGSVMFSSSRI